MKTSLENKEKANKSMRRNYFLISLFIVMIVIAILVKMFHISLVEGAQWREEGDKVVKSNITISPMRGNIYSCNGELMATTEYEYRIYIDFWADGMKKDTLFKYINPLSAELAKNFPEKTGEQYKSHIKKGWENREKEEARINSGINVKRNREYLLLNRKLNYLELQTLKSMPFFRKRSTNHSGLISRRFVKRLNPYGTLALRTIGDVYGNYSREGKNGLEMQYDSLLRGTPGLGTQRKINGRMVIENDVNPVDGKDIVSTIDVDIQDITEKSLMRKLKELDAESGTAVVMEVATGEIKAISNLDRVQEGVWKERNNHAVADELEQGSTFKIASMMVALEDGVVHPADTIDTFKGEFKYAGKRMTDHNIKHGGYGIITASQTIRYSSNIGVARLILKAYENCPERYVDGLYKLGLTEPLDLEIPGAGKAKIKKPGDKKSDWSKTTLPWMSFGYETQIPPIYTLTFFNAIANDGKMVRPYFVREIRQNGSVEEYRKPVVIRKKICSSKTLETIREMLVDVVESKDGTGKPVKSEYVRIAGKTGTAQVNKGKMGYSNREHRVSFCGYFPADAPQYSCIVVILKPRNGYPSGGTMSGAVFKRIAEEVNALKKPLNVREAFPDTLHSPLPYVQAGMYHPAEYVMDKLDVSYEEQKITSPCISVGLQKNKIAINNREVAAGVVPNVKEMGAKDAVYLLEERGLRVNLSGRGSVREQSLPAGSRISRGQTIVLTLR
ncbi:MAG: transpeptidase family protein [Dysgonamonadaceae bacterium]|jgi:cell division protein FtsI (penicillin-binding protein 3)|nr:transpeptidase family protein [Dysgonamonadaceae bacterium]